jgi:PAS domain S-box-containing protein
MARQERAGPVVTKGKGVPAETKATAAPEAAAPSVISVGPAETLARSEERFHLLVDAVRDYAIFMLDPDGIVASWNTGAQRIKGYMEEEIVGRHFSLFYTPEDRAAGVPAGILHDAATQGRRRAEGWRVRRDGTRFWAEVTISSIRGENGALLGFAKVTRDLTERHAAEEALRRSEERFRLLVEGVRDYAIFMLDPDGTVSSWNAGAQRIKGYAPEEIIGRHFSAFYTPEDLAAGKPARVLEEARRAGRFEDEDWRVRKDGTRFWASVVLTALRDSAGGLVGFAKITRDLTARRAAEEDRRHRLAAEEAARARGEFLSVAAHELKTPITALRGRAQLALRRFRRDGALAADQTGHALEVIDEQAGKISRLVDQLLDVSRLESGHLTLERSETDLAALVASVATMFRGRDDGDRIRLDVPGHPVPVLVDALRMEQVVTNIIENALKYSPGDSPVRVEVRGGQGSGAGPGRISVRDEGPGVPPEDRTHLFERFFRSGATSHTAGMGLGLYVSREIVERHGGTIRAEFPPSGGTTVVVELGDGETEGD